MAITFDLEVEAVVFKWSDFQQWVETHLPQLQQQVAPEVTSKFFEEAIDYINTHDWCQGAEADLDGRVCLRGAFGKAVMTDVPFNGKLLRGVQHLDQAGLHVASRRGREILTLMGVDADQFRTIPIWNDFPGRTKEEVIDALTLAAKTLRDRGL